MSTKGLKDPGAATLLNLEDHVVHVSIKMLPFFPQIILPPIAYIDHRFSCWLMSCHWSSKCISVLHRLHVVRRRYSRRLGQLSPWTRSTVIVGWTIVESRRGRLLSLSWSRISLVSLQHVLRIRCWGGELLETQRRVRNKEKLLTQSEIMNCQY